MKKKWLIIILLLIIVCIVIAKSGLWAKKEKEYSLTKVKKGTLINQISASGVVKADEEVELKFQTSGQLVWVGVQEGDFVEKWQAVAQLDTQELYRSLQKYLRDYSKERWDFDQDRETYNVTEDNLDKYTLTNEVRRILEKNQFDLEKAVLDVELREIALKYATLVTPIAGIVTRIDTPIAGVNITPATAVFTISNPQSVYFSANIDEIDIGKIKVGQQAKIVLDSFPDQELESEVAQIGFTAVKTTGGGTAFPVKIPLFQNEDQKFKSGMNGDLEIILEKRGNILYLPLSAIIKKQGKRYIWLVEKERAKKQEVQTGLETEEDIEIIEGLKEGDEVIAKNLSKVEEGEKVE